VFSVLIQLHVAALSCSQLRWCELFLTGGVPFHRSRVGRHAYSRQDVSVPYPSFCPYAPFCISHPLALPLPPCVFLLSDEILVVSRGAAILFLFLPMSFREWNRRRCLLYVPHYVRLDIMYLSSRGASVPLQMHAAPKPPFGLNPVDSRCSSVCLFSLHAIQATPAP